MTDLIPTFGTAVNTWQCDENDHLNVQFYTDFAHEASASTSLPWSLSQNNTLP